MYLLILIVFTSRLFLNLLSLLIFVLQDISACMQPYPIKQGLLPRFELVTSKLQKIATLSLHKGSPSHYENSTLK